MTSELVNENETLFFFIFTDIFPSFHHTLGTNNWMRSMVLQLGKNGALSAIYLDDLMLVGTEPSVVNWVADPKLYGPPSYGYDISLALFLSV